MPGETDIEVGDSEESAVDVALPAEGEEVTSSETSFQEEELDEYSGRVKTRIDQLTNRFREEERQKQTAIQFAENVHLENESLKQRLGSLDKGYQEQFGGRVTSEIDSAKKSLKDAHESGDIDKIVEAQESMTNLAYQKGRLESVKGETAAYEAQAQAQYQQAAQLQQAAQHQQAAQPQQAAPPPDQKAQGWASRNDWFGQDEVMTYAAFGLHRKLVEAEASASRNKGGRKTVRLTPSQVAIAKRLNVPLEEYAKYVRD